MTQLEMARAGTISPEMKRVAADENLTPDEIRERVSAGTVVIPANVHHAGLVPAGVGAGLRTKVNANIGASPERSGQACEMGKLRAALDAGADAVMDLSIGEETDAIRRMVVANSPVMVGTVPIYQVMLECGGPDAMTAEAFLDVFERHARDGVDFATVHAGLLRATIPMAKDRLMGVVSRGGSFLVNWMSAHGRENFLYERFDDILAIAREHDVTMSLGDGLRPGCIADATDEAQLHELTVLGELTQRCRKAGVQVMVEGPGHVPLDQIAENMRLQKERCDGAPFYVLGPLPTDIAPGYDHIVSAIGGALAASTGADFLCYVTPKEHVGLPEAADVRAGVMVARIAAHVGDVAKGIPGARDADDRMSRARGDRDWDAMQAVALDPELFAEMIKDESRDDKCSMCGDYCAIKVFRDAVAE